ncbi:MAG: adenine deaminase [Oligoflexia bacterium]|nr:adenine deaminase [Oligoflexia bacterium]
MESLSRLVKVASGKSRGDLLLKNCKIVNVFSSKIEEGDVLISDRKIAGVGVYERKHAHQLIDIKGAYVAPGLIDAHVHIESAMVSPFEFAKAIVPLGTTSVIVDPHEIANVLGQDGIKFMLESSKNNHISFYFMLPSCVPATHLETSGSTLLAKDLEPFIDEPWVRGIGEVMNFPAVIGAHHDILKKVLIGKQKRVDGHAPGVSGHALNAYVAAGILSDHECVTTAEAREKLARGMKILIREGSCAKNLETLLPLVEEKNCARFSFCTDDRLPEDLVAREHINYCVKRAVKLGLDPVMAIKMATINTAEHYKIERKGAVVPGYWADLIVFDNFKNFNIQKVFRSGQVVALDFKFTAKSRKRKTSPIRGTVNVGHFSEQKLKIKEVKHKALRVIKLIKNQLLTEEMQYRPRCFDAARNILSDVEHDILKIAVVERHLASGHVGVGFVHGFGLKQGAIASTVAHDSHNIIIIGTNDGDMEIAVKSLIESQGGEIVVLDGKVKALLPLPIAGLMSKKSVQEVNKQKQKLLLEARKQGVRLENPFITMSFLSLPVIPKLKLTDRGLVDVLQFDFTSLFV